MTRNAKPSAPGVCPAISTGVYGYPKELAAAGAVATVRSTPTSVEAAVLVAFDDDNLRRLIGLLAELRRSSQLVIITHQKPTMEIADALYGVSMRGDGITGVISQRLRELETA